MPNVNFLRFRGTTKHCHLMGGVGCSSVTECLPDTGAALGSFSSTPQVGSFPVPSLPQNSTWGNRPVGKQKAETEYSLNDFLKNTELQSMWVWMEEYMFYNN